jgi:hypothetical protein
MRLAPGAMSARTPLKLYLDLTQTRFSRISFLIAETCAETLAVLTGCIYSILVCCLDRYVA